MKRFFLKYWWLFLILPFVFTVALIHLFSNVPSVLDTIIFWLFFLSLLGLITSWILLLANEKWWQSIVVFISLIPLAFLLFILSFAAMAGPDGFGQKHPIPEGLNYNLPLQIDYYSKKSDEVVEIDSLDTSTYLGITMIFIMELCLLVKSFFAVLRQLKISLCQSPVLFSKTLKYLKTVEFR